MNAQMMAAGAEVLPEYIDDGLGSGRVLPEVPQSAYGEDSVELPDPDFDSLAEYRVEVLGKAAHVVSADRNVTYGAPEDSFQMISNLWSAYLGIETTAVDVAMLLALLKVARIAANPSHEDSYVDLAGYAACGASAAKVLIHESEQ